MIDVLSNSAIFLLMILLGYGLKQRGILKPEHRNLLSFLLLNVTIPCSLIAGFNFDLELMPLLGAFICAAVGCLALDFLSMALTRGRHGKERAGALLLSNGYLAAPFTLPFVQVNMGPAAGMIAAAFDMAQGFFNMGFNYVFAQSLCAGPTEKKGGFHPLMILKTMGRSLIIVTYVVLLILSILNVRLPAFIRDLTGRIGAANVFIAMLYVGMVLDFRLDRAKLGQLVRALLVRYGGAALLAVLMLYVLPLDTTTAQVLTLGFFSPVSNAALAYSDHFGCDMQVAGAAGSLSFIVSMLVFTSLLLAWA